MRVKLFCFPIHNLPVSIPPPSTSLSIRPVLYLIASVIRRAPGPPILDARSTISRLSVRSLVSAMVWLRGAFALGSSRSKARRSARGPKKSSPKARAPNAAQALSRPIESSSDDPGPLDSASQHRPSRDSEWSVSGISMFASPAPSIVVSDVSASTTSTSSASPFGSSSEPSTGITTPSVKGEGKVERRGRPQLRRLPTLVSKQQTEPPLPGPTSGSSQEGCKHPKMLITKGENLACMACENRDLKSVFVCTDEAGTPKRHRHIQQSSDVSSITPQILETPS